MMAIVTATEVTVYTDVSATAGTIVSSGLIPIVQDRINQITNNWFLGPLQIEGSFLFNSALSTIYGSSDFAVAGFLAGDEIYVYNSARNDGYKVVGSVTSSTITLASGYSVIYEVLPRDIFIGVIKWPVAIKYVAAQMVKFDFDDRPAGVIGITSHSLGPFSESFGQAAGGTPFGYPLELIDALTPYINVRTL
jgi:hypothetical protein